VRKKCHIRFVFSKSDTIVACGAHLRLVFDLGHVIYLITASAHMHKHVSNFKNFTMITC